MSKSESFDTIVVGGGQAGLAIGYFLAQQAKPFTILDENKRTGDSWRQRWQSLRLFTPSQYNGLPGMSFPKSDFYFPTKDEVADYLEQYATRFELPVKRGVQVTALTREGDQYQLSTSAGVLQSKNIVIATGAYQKPHTPTFARELEAAIVQFHSSAYCNPLQISAQKVLVVGAGNSGAEIALDLARAGKRVWLAGRDVGHIPADRLGRVLGGRPYWWFISRILSIHTPIGRKMKSNVMHHGNPLIGTNRQELLQAGIEITPRVTGILSGKPQVEGERTLPAEAVIWATGFRPNFHWVKLPVFDEYGLPKHQRGIVPEAPGLFFIGLHFQTALSSALLGGVGTDAHYIAGKIANRARSA